MDFAPLGVKGSEQKESRLVCKILAYGECKNTFGVEELFIE